MGKKNLYVRDRFLEGTPVRLSFLLLRLPFCPSFLLDCRIRATVAKLNPKRAASRRTHFAKLTANFDAQVRSRKPSTLQTAAPSQIVDTQIASSRRPNRDSPSRSSFEMVLSFGLV